MASSVGASYVLVVLKEAIDSDGHEDSVISETLVVSAE